MLLVAASIVVFGIASGSQVGWSAVSTWLLIASVPGVLAACQVPLLRAGHFDPALIGVAGLGGVLIGTHSVTAGSGEVVIGLILALLASIPFAALGWVIASKVWMPAALAAAVAVVIGADMLSGVLLSETENTDGPLTTWLGQRYLGVPGSFIGMLVVFLIAALVTSGAIDTQNSGITLPGGQTQSHPGLLVYLSVFALSCSAGVFAVANQQAVTGSDISESQAIASILALAAGGCGLFGADDAKLTDAFLGTLFASSLLYYLYATGVGAAQIPVYLGVATAVFVLIDLARRRAAASMQS
ncbi:hypothetical protein [Streptomyces sp. NPDC004376]